MTEGDHVDVSEEVNPSVPTLSQPPQTHAPLPLTPACVLPVYSSALPTHLPPPASSGAPLPPASPTSTAKNDQARIAALEGTVNQMATNMAELLALLRGPNRASSSSTPPPGPGPTVDPTPGAPPTQALENVVAPAPPTLYTSTIHPFTSQLPPPPAPLIIEARKGNHLHRLAAYYERLNRGTSVPQLSRFFPGPLRIIGGTLDGPSSDFDDTSATPSAVYAVTEEIPSGVHIRLAQENEELDNWTSVPRCSAVIADV
ncbi:hypothetical protein CDL15_Pgr014186 [Punica granatum]|uniref:Uncharacterized protein n=1 Tax=Punica granatum TaxID=22663 RepID=A0A218XD23_PUNGR|nr:hypothetical protein CDL15_Pgr014186 [Punica granatum]